MVYYTLSRNVTRMCGKFFKLQPIKIRSASFLLLFGRFFKKDAQIIDKDLKSSFSKINKI